MGNRWGGLVDGGFGQVPRSFVRNTGRLGISGDVAMVIVAIHDYQWRDELPFPKVERLAESLGQTDRTIRRHLAWLRKKGYLTTRSRMGRSSEYDFTGLYEAIEGLEVVEPDKPVGSAPSEPSARSVEAKDEAFELLEESEVVPCPVRHDSPDMADMTVATGPYKQKNGHKKPTLGSAPSGGRGLAQLVIEAQSRSDAAKLTHRPVKKGSNPARALQKHLAKPPDKYNANDLEFVFRRAWGDKWKTRPPRFTMRDKKHAKDLNEEFGPADTAKVVSQTIHLWEDITRQFGLNGYPSMPMIFGFRRSLFPTILDGSVDGTKRPKWGTHFDEAEHSRPAGQEGGWGDQLS